MYCSKCGGLISEGGAFCPRCGQPTHVVAAAAAPAAVAPRVAGAVAPATYPGVQFAGFWLRLVAYLVDGLIIGAGFIALLIPLALMMGLGSAFQKIQAGEDPGQILGLIGISFILAFIGIAIGGTWLYYALLESSSWQATVGKRALSLKVTDLAGNPISFGRASGRHFSKIITGMIPLGIGYILAGITQKKQALHDMIASCLVLRS